MMDFKVLPLKKVKKYSVELSLTIAIILTHFLGFRLEGTWMKLVALLGVVYISYSCSKACALLSVVLFLILFGVHEGMHYEDEEKEGMTDSEDIETSHTKEECDEEDEECKQRQSQLDVQETFRNMN